MSDWPKHPGNVEAALERSGREIDRLRAEVSRLTEENRRLREALERIAAWDCLNPPDPSLCGDLPWLSDVVRAALKGHDDDN